MHQRLYRARDEAVVDEEVFLDIERGVSAFQIAGPVILDAMSERQVLRARRRADRVGLYEAERPQRTRQRRRREKAAGDGEPSQIGERGHDDWLRRAQRSLAAFARGLARCSAGDARITSGETYE